MSRIVVVYTVRTGTHAVPFSRNSIADDVYNARFYVHTFGFFFIYKKRQERQARACG